MNKPSFDRAFWPQEMDFATDRRNSTDHLYLLDLVKVLRPHPAGLRRWSVMRRIRACREAAGLPIAQRMEDEVERAFRNHCADSEKSRRHDTAPHTALFHWPQGKLAGVWGVHTDRADAWLKTQGIEL